MIGSIQLSGVQRLLCLGAHSDDIEIGAGGTVLRAIRENPAISVCWVVVGGESTRQTEARSSAAAWLAGVNRPRVETWGFRDAYFPSQIDAIKDRFESLKAFDPQLILTHARDDAHQDHRVVNQLTWNTWRDHLILEYEILKYDSDLHQPNGFVWIEEETLERKISMLEAHFPSQRQRQWFDRETFRGLARVRGVQCNSPTRFAEAFHVRKLLI
jgi:LmbE family N-acetylglucosaminyl deacetylase